MSIYIGILSGLSKHANVQKAIEVAKQMSGKSKYPISRFFTYGPKVEGLTLPNPLGMLAAATGSPAGLVSGGVERAAQSRAMLDRISKGGKGLLLPTISKKEKIFMEKMTGRPMSELQEIAKQRMSGKYMDTNPVSRYATWSPIGIGRAIRRRGLMGRLQEGGGALSKSEIEMLNTLSSMASPTQKAKKAIIPASILAALGGGGAAAAS